MAAITRDMNRSDSLDINSLLADMQSSNGSNIYQILVDLNILADRETALFVREFCQSDLTPFLNTLPTLPERTKTCAFRLLGKVFKLTTPRIMISKYVQIFIRMLSEDYDEEIKTFYLKQLLQCSQTSEGIGFLLEDVKAIQILELVARNLQEKSLAIAKHASDVIKAVFKSTNGINHLLSDDFMKIFFNLLEEQAAIVRFRVYQLFVEALVVNESLIDNQNVVKIIDLLIVELDSIDILSQLNCLELLSGLASSSSKALRLITECGTLQRLRGLFRDQEVDPLQRFLLPGTVKFFGSIATVLPSRVLIEYPDFQSFLFENANSDDIILKTLCLETIASISSSKEGLSILYQYPREFGMTMGIIAKEILSPADEALKTRIIDALKVILTKSDGHLSNESSVIKKELYSQLSEQPMHLLMKCSQVPFSKVRYSALSAIQAIACHSWSEQDMVETPGFLEYLLDRQTESEKEGKELKYDILKTLAQSETSAEVFGKDCYEQICEYVAEGPFYSAQQTAVDYEMKD